LGKSEWADQSQRKSAQTQFKGLRKKATQLIAARRERAILDSAGPSVSQFARHRFSYADKAI
jgi:hypothetical protein